MRLPLIANYGSAPMEQQKSSMLRTYLKRVLKQWRMTLMLQGLALTATAAVLLVGLSMFIDYAVGLGSGARAALLALCVAGVAVVAVRYLIRPLRRVPSDLQVARYVEERYPELNDGFVSAVEFEDKPLEGTSHVFLDQLIEKVTTQTTRIDFAHIIDPRRARRSQGAAFIAIGLLAVFAMQDVDMFSRSAARLATPWARPGNLLSTELDVSPGDARLRRGASQMITVKVMGRQTPAVRLWWKPEGQDEWRSVEMFETDETGVFTHEISGLETDTEYYADAEPARSSTYTLTVYDAPFVERIDLAYRYPAYTGLSPKTDEDGGDITAPVGTSVTLTITASKPVESAALEFSNGKTQKLDVKEKTLTGRLTVQEDLSYKIRLVDLDNLPNENPVEYYIRAISDQAPRVVITDPGRDTRVSPVDEVMIQAEAEDDFGLSAFTLRYAVNGGQEQTIDLSAESRKSSGSFGTLWEGQHIFYLETLSLEPGDFITYYAEATDRRGDAAKSATDMYFLDIKPFEETFRQGMAGGGGGGGMNGLNPGQLSQEQKEIIAATWRVERDQKQAGAEQTRKDLKAIADAQDGLRSRVEDAVSVVLFQGGMDKTPRQMADLLRKALDPMERASGPLRAGSAAGALPPEREALQYLLKVDALIREYIVTQSNRNMAQSSAPLDMSDTSELELNRDESKYETLDQADQGLPQSQTVEESLRRVKELARRQQQLNNQMWDLANANNRSEAERRRERDRLTREQRQLREQAEQLARSLSQMPTQSSPREMSQSMQQATQGLRESSEQMARSAQQLQRNDLQQAANQGAQALQRLEDVDRQLQRAQTRSLEQMVRDAVRRADQLATRQEQLERAVEELKEEKDRDYSGIKARAEALNSGRGGLTEEDKARRVSQFVQRRLSEIAETKDRIRRDLERLKDDLEFLAGQAQQAQPETKQALQDAKRNIDDKRLAEQIDGSKGLLREKTLDRSLQTEQRLTRDLKQLAEQVRTAQDNLVIPDQEQLARTQEQIREAMSELQNLQRELNRLQRRNQQLGQQPSEGQQRALSQEYQQQLQNLRDILNRLPQNSSQAQALRDQLNNAVALGNEPWKFDHGDWAELSRNLGRTLADLNQDANERLQNLIQQEKLHMAKDEDVPPEYRDLVNQYYEKLSKRLQE